MTFDDAGKAMFVAGARRMLIESAAVGEHQYGEYYVLNPEVYSAIHYFRETILKDEVLSESIKAKWTPAILDAWGENDHHKEMVKIAYSLNPAGVLEWLHSVLSRSLQSENGHCLELRKLKFAWDKGISETILSIARDNEPTETSAYWLVYNIYECDPYLSFELWKHYSDRLSKGDDIFKKASLALAANSLFTYWEELWPVICGDTELISALCGRNERYEGLQFYDTGSIDFERKLADYYLRLREVIPPNEDTEFISGRVPHRVILARQRDGVLSVLAKLATEESIKELERILITVPADDHSVWARWSLRDAIRGSRRKDWKPNSYQFVLDLIADSNQRWLRSENELLELVIESLERLYLNLQKSSNSPKADYWEVRKDGRKVFRKPDGETGISRRIANWLELDLPKALGVTVQVEVQRQSDQRTDIQVNAIGVRGNDLRQIEVIIEVKGCWHPELWTAHNTQLVDRYLKQSGRTHGLYLVIWTECKSWNDDSDSRESKFTKDTFEDAQKELSERINGIDPPYVVRPFLLDVTL